MDTVVIAVGSNLGDRNAMFHTAAQRLIETSLTTPEFATIWQSEPVGPALYPFLNSVAIITTRLNPLSLLARLKETERSVGRAQHPEKWGPRPLDLDIIAWGNLAMETETLIIPHPEYRSRRFVLLPLQELRPEWRDPVYHTPIEEMIREAPPVEMEPTEIPWIPNPENR